LDDGHDVLRRDTLQYVKWNGGKSGILLESCHLCLLHCHWRCLTLADGEGRRLGWRMWLVRGCWLQRTSTARCEQEGIVLRHVCGVHGRAVFAEGGEVSRMTVSTCSVGEVEMSVDGSARQRIDQQPHVVPFWKETEGPSNCGSAEVSASACTCRRDRPAVQAFHCLLWRIFGNWTCTVAATTTATTTRITFPWESGISVHILLTTTILRRRTQVNGTLTDGTNARRLYAREQEREG